jgi:hypothetical protein
MRPALVAATVTLAVSIASFAEEPAKAPGPRIMLMLETKFVEGRKLQGPPEEYVPDKDPKSIELVQLPKGDPGPSRVSSDGQVIFLTVADVRSSKANDALIEQAFDILERRQAEAAIAK